MHPFAILYFLLCGGVSLILWVQMVGILKGKGCDTSFFMVVPDQYIQFYKLIKSEENPEVKKKYSWIFWTQVTIIPLYFLGMILIIANFQ
jgi:hypothetical protein